MIQNEEEMAQHRNRVANLIQKIQSAATSSDAVQAMRVVEGYLKALGDLDALPWSECNVLLLRAQDTCDGWSGDAS
ncbi:hypothetical protein D3C75_1310770 [compost metagenome]